MLSNSAVPGAGSQGHREGGQSVSVEVKANAQGVEPVTTSPSKSTRTELACRKGIAVMVLRVSCKTGQSLWGCSTFPKCRGTLNIQPQS